MSENLVISEKVGHTALVTLNRSDKKNALTTAMYEELVSALTEAAADTGIRTLVLRGSGGSFTSGNDLKDFMAAEQLGMDTPVMRFLDQLARFPKPLLASVQGCAIGIGTTLLLHCEFVLSAEDAFFQTPFIRLGLVPEGASSLLMPRALGYQTAAKMLLLGQQIDAQEALAIGLVSELVASANLDERALALAEQLNQLPPAAMRASKSLLKAATLEQTLTTIAEEAKLFGEGLQSDEAKEAFTAFFEKRQPDWSRFV